jgi:hypothetical protein
MIWRRDWEGIFPVFLILISVIIRGIKPGEKHSCQREFTKGNENYFQRKSPPF